jgi:enoyl-CoA hydratase/carnithine racemase
MSEPVVLVTIAPVAKITLNRPDKQNAMSAEMGFAFRDAVDQVNASDVPRVVLIEGSGRAFSAGGDFSLIEGNSRKSGEQNRREMPEFYWSFLSVIRLRVPSVAVLGGAAVGAGLCLAMACDIRLAAREAKLGANFVKVGLHPGMGGTLLLPRLVGPAKAAELLLTGKLVDGAEAERIGLVNAAVPRGELEALVEATAKSIASAAPIAVRQTKETLTRPLLEALDAQLAREAECQAVDFASEDLKEAVTAFRAGRPPSFSGR